MNTRILNVRIRSQIRRILMGWCAVVCLGPAGALAGITTVSVGTTAWIPTSTNAVQRTPVFRGTNRLV